MTNPAEKPPESVAKLMDAFDSLEAGVNALKARNELWGEVVGVLGAVQGSTEYSCMERDVQDRIESLLTRIAESEKV